MNCHVPNPGARDEPSFASLDCADSAWNRLAATAPFGDPVCLRTEWQWSFHEAFAPHRSLHFAAGGDSVVGFAEDQHPRVGPLLMPIEASWLFGCPLLGEHAPELARQLRDQRSQAGERRALLVSGLEPGGARERELLQRLPHRGVWQVATETFCSASLHGGVDGFLSRRSAKLRRNLRQAQRRGADLGVRFERHRPSTAAEVDALYARIQAVENRSWKGLAEQGMNMPGPREFYLRMLGRLATSRAARVIFARHGERDVGFIFGGVVDSALAGRVYRGQQFSFVDDWRRHSLGNLLAIAKITWLCEDGVQRYDMGPIMDYKVHWTEQQVHAHALLFG
jgi:hypothetical protein